MRYSVRSNTVGLSQVEAEVKKVGGQDIRVTPRVRQVFCDLTPAQGIKSPPPVPPKNAKPPPDEATLNRYEALRRWRKLRAEARGVQPDIILSNHILMQLARRNPASIKALAAVTALDEWQRETYGPDLLRTLKDHPG